MDERLRFIARLLEGEKLAPVCREFGISGVTGYKIFERYKACGLEGLHDRDAMRPVAWVRINEIEGGDWAIGGKALHASDVHALASEQAA